MTRAVAVIVIALAVLTAAVGTAAADEPYRLGLRYGERIGIPHEGPMCWRFAQGPRGRWRAVIVEGHRPERGAPCRGPRIAIVRFPRGVQEDGVRVWTRQGRIWVFALGPD